MTKAKSLMILGTASGVGKSLITAGFCRLFSDWGFSVAPFKAQNMSNNSYVTDDGGEIGRAQAVQAECARVKPTVDMNPILLKPAADNSSQVVLQGKAIGHFTARNYYSEKLKIINAIQESYSRLVSKHEVIVLEGAGSPAEINLKENDIVNMKMAEMADARCILVGDIDRGGVFASLIGTLELLEPREKERIDGFIINKFRGDQTLLQPGLDFLEKRTGKKVLGVIPYDRELWIQEEDSLLINPLTHSAKEDLDIAVILLPRISNFTDFEILRKEPGVRLRYVKNPQEIEKADLVILPGTKATIDDWNYLINHGFKTALLDFVNKGGNLLGICGGFQILGESIEDLNHIESKSSKKKGLGIIEMRTEFFPEKTVKQISEDVTISLFGSKVSGHVNGYEIHMGQASYEKKYARFGGGIINETQNVVGTYWHGLFDETSFRKSFLRALAKNVHKSFSEVNESLSLSELKEVSYQRLVNLLSQNLDVKFLRQLLQLSSKISVNNCQI